MYPFLLEPKPPSAAAFLKDGVQYACPGCALLLHVKLVGVPAGDPIR